MAFPLETSHLISHLRGSYLYLYDDEESRRIIKPFEDDPNGDVYQHIFDKLCLSTSPPITSALDTLLRGKAVRGSKDMSNALQASKSIKRKHKLRGLTQSRGKNEGERQSGYGEHKRSSDDGNDIEKRNSDNGNDIDEDNEGGSNVRNESSNESSSNNAPNNDYEHIDYDSEDNSNSQLDYTETIKSKTKKRPNIMRLFQKDSNEIENDSSDGSIRTTILDDHKTEERNLNGHNYNHNHDHLSDSNSDATEKMGGDITDEEANNDISSDSKDTKSHNGTILTSNDDQGDSLLSHKEAGSNVIDGEEEEDDDDEEDDEDDDDYDSFDEYLEEGEVSSGDSAFTEIETESINDTSLLGSYDIDTHTFSYNNKNDILNQENKKQKKKNGIDTTFDGILNSSNDPESGKFNIEKSNKHTTSLNKLDENKSNLSFEKIVPPSLMTSNNETKSNLSSLIHSKFKSASNNPLDYYLFANSGTMGNIAKKVNIDVFVPGNTRPVLKDLPINNNIATSDCIGYILFHLFKGKHFDIEDETNSMDPNDYRLELVDEDGENYGSFGILERTRLLASYNNPRELAICRVTDEKERKMNEKQSPLALEFKQNLIKTTQNPQPTESYNSFNKDISADNDKSEINVTLAFDNNKKMKQFTIVIDNNAVVKELLYDICTQRGLNPINYKLRSNNMYFTNVDNVGTLGEQTKLQGNLDGQKKILRSNELIGNLDSKFIEVIPVKNTLTGGSIGKSINEGTLLNSGITPNESLSIITPQGNESTIEGNLDTEEEHEEHERQEKEKDGFNKDHHKPTNGERTTNKEVTKNIRQQQKTHPKNDNESNKFLDGIMGMNSLLPPSLNTIYFKWKVWRKKTTILNKIEKSLIIDGDYIHLAPADDIVFKKDPSDNPFLSSHSHGGHSSQHHHHHRHLHHYNYSNYYNSSMMKTSSFHITQIVKLKQYTDSKNPNHFKIVISKPGNTHSKETTIKKKYDLEAANEIQCTEIIKKINWVIQVYNTSDMVNVR